MKIVYERPGFYVIEVSKGFEVYRNGITTAARCAIIGYTGQKGLARAIVECNKETKMEPDTMVSTAVNELLCERLANLIRHTEDLRDGSFDGKRYDLTIGKAAAKACAEMPALAPLVTTMILVCYTETDEFCRQVLGPIANEAVRAENKKKSKKAKPAVVNNQVKSEAAQ